jgi:hypothetical protein
MKGDDLSWPEGDTKGRDNSFAGEGIKLVLPIIEPIYEGNFSRDSHWATPALVRTGEIQYGGYIWRDIMNPFAQFRAITEQIQTEQGTVVIHPFEDDIEIAVPESSVDCARDHLPDTVCEIDARVATPSQGIETTEEIVLDAH